MRNTKQSQRSLQVFRSSWLSFHARQQRTICHGGALLDGFLIDQRHTKLESTVRYLGIEIDDALNILNSEEMTVGVRAMVTLAPRSDDDGVGYHVTSVDNFGALCLHAFEIVLHFS